MILLSAGVSHRTGTVETRERLAARKAPEALEALRLAGFGEGVALSTCNRFELYVASPDASDMDRLSDALDGLAGEALGPQAYRLSGPAAARHLFSVAAGLDSMVVGEGEILGQVKAAYETARSGGMTGKLLNVLFQRAVFAGKQARSSTGIGAGHTSVAGVAVELAERIFGALSKSEVLILGAGQMAELTAKLLVAAQVRRLSIANRTPERAAALAARFGGSALAWEAFAPALETADVVVSSTGASLPVLTVETVRKAMASRRGRPLFVIDIAMPRDVEEAVHGLDGVFLYRLEDLDAIVRENMAARELEVEKARGLVHALALEFGAWLEAHAGGRALALRHSEA